MKLQKHDCKIKAYIEPLGAEQLYVCFDFGDSKLEFVPSSVMGEQFGDFLSALYTLYYDNNNERFDGHSEWDKREYQTDEFNKIQATTVTVEWDGEGTFMILEMIKSSGDNIITLRTSMDYGKTYTEYIVNDRDFCYAITKAYTDALKKFGFYGFQYSTEGEPVKIHQLLFLKAYALNNLEARNFTVVDEEFDCCKTDFENEIELLLFDM